ncbi:hypothetical protein V5799_018067 [Amblyomma americanum]|uniref:Enoyl reductase (ER) domain-containing protein n=1 Tax=Amblyomma americanum TaxID=6943 RepID=A0AAQ4F1G0_AMBAM
MPWLEKVLVRARYAGVNVSDVNAIAGRFNSEIFEPRFDLGFKSVGDIFAVGAHVGGFKVGDAVATLNFSKLGAFAEYQCLRAEHVFPVPKAVPEIVPLLMKGQTAVIGLDRHGRIRAGETVLVTSGAGGLGHLVVQCARAARCHAVATCSSDQKEAYLRSLGCEVVVNYCNGDLDAELSRAYTDGFDVFWETIGGKTFDVLFSKLRHRGRLMVVGAASC